MLNYCSEVRKQLVATIRSHAPMFALLLLVGAASHPAPPAAGPAGDEPAFLEEIHKYRQRRDARLRSPFSPLALVHREYLKERPRVTLGSSPEADLRLEDDAVAPRHAVIEGGPETPLLKALGNTVIETVGGSSSPVRELGLKDGREFRLGRFFLRYRVMSPFGRVVDVYDSEHPALRGFRGLDFFPIDAAYRVRGEVVPAETPQQMSLIDSHGNQQPYWLYGELKFTLQGTPCRLELYAETLDPETIRSEGYMLIFSDATSGKETYPAARYLYVEGKPRGEITVDFNKAYNPPCNFSPVFTCPFPRPQNRLPVAIRAGEKWYREK